MVFLRDGRVMQLMPNATTSKVHSATSRDNINDTRQTSDDYHVVPAFLVPASELSEPVMIPEAAFISSGDSFRNLWTCQQGHQGRTFA
jgi:hypothetical protein